MNIIVSNFGTGYFLRSGEEFIKFWDKYFKKDEKKTLFILGLGFDPRALKCLEIILDKSQTSTVNCMVIQYDDNFQNREPMSTSLQTNITKLESLIPRDQWISKTIHMMSGTDYVGSVEAAQIIEKEDCNGYTDIILDISSMPNGIYFPIVRKLLDWIKTKEIKLNNDKEVNFHLV